MSWSNLVTSGASGEYTVEIVGLGGFTVTLDSAEVAGSSDYLVADEMFGIPLGDWEFPLSLVGAGIASGYLGDSDMFVGGIKEIRVLLKQPPGRKAADGVDRANRPRTEN